MATPRLSVSTWSLHRQLGKPGFTGPAHDMQIPIETHDKGPISLLELPAHVAEFGIRTLEICHFHLPSVEKPISLSSAPHSQLRTLNFSLY